MKLQIMSDLHFEMHADGGAELIRELDPTGVDVLVLAGDITMARHYEDLASVFKPLAREVSPHPVRAREPRVLQVIAEGGRAKPGEADERVSRGRDPRERYRRDRRSAFHRRHDVVSPRPDGGAEQALHARLLAHPGLRAVGVRAKRRLREGAGHPRRSGRRRRHASPAGVRQRSCRGSRARP